MKRLFAIQNTIKCLGKGWNDNQPPKAVNSTCSSCGFFQFSFYLIRVCRHSFHGQGQHSGFRCCWSRQHDLPYCIAVFEDHISRGNSFCFQDGGAGRKDEAGKYLQYFLCLTLLLLPLISLLPGFFRLFFWLMKPDRQVAEAAMQYMAVRLYEIPALLLVSSFTAFLLGIGNSLLPMILNWVAVLVNVGANWVLVFGHWGFPPLGLVGAAWGTVFAVWVQAVLFALCIWFYYRKEYNLHRWHWPSWQDLWRISKVGLPLGVTDSIEVGAFTAFFAIISRLGTVALAASQIVNQIAALAFMPGFALGAATGSLVGRYLGAGQADRAEELGWTGTKLCVSVMVALG
ncbi:MAG: MATE family efflux transporter, partial [Firmicutes bacterium]|nr:MATE family efflux transporter [Bacillota bacterium]